MKKTTPRHEETRTKVELRRYRERLHPDENGQVSSRESVGQIWQMLANNDECLYGRQRLLSAAGWDPAGWALQNWKQLPEQLQFDLCKMGLDKIQRIVEDK